jgi:cyclopropane-fatty-acyl-phospholipid synthase
MYRVRLQAAFDALQFDQPFRVILPDGSTATHGQGPPAFTIHIKTNRAARDIIIKSSLGFGEAYTRGEVDVEGDLQAVALMSYELQERLLKGSLWSARCMLGFFARRNTLSGSKKNIAAQ